MIHGITPAFAEAGKIKIGGLGAELPKQSGEGTWRMPVKLDHFRVTKTTRGRDGQLELDEELMAALPKGPDGNCRELPIMVHSDVVDEVFPTRYAKYVGRSLACSGDGMTSTFYKIGQNGKPVGEPAVRTGEGACLCEDLVAAKCKPNGILHCSIVVPGRAVAGAVHKWRTTSLVSVQQMLGSLIQIKELCGGLKGLPLMLVVKPIQVSPQGKATTVYCCHVELREHNIGQLQNQLIEARRMRAVVAGEIPYAAVLQLPAASDEPDDEQADTANEFYPTEQVDQQALPQRKGAKLLGELRDGKGSTVEPEPEPEPEPHDPNDKTPSECMALFEKWRDLDGSGTRDDLLHSVLGPAFRTGMQLKKEQRELLITRMRRDLDAADEKAKQPEPPQPVKAVGKAGF